MLFHKSKIKTQEQANAALDKLCEQVAKLQYQAAELKDQLKQIKAEIAQARYAVTDETATVHDVEDMINSAMTDHICRYPHDH